MENLDLVKLVIVLIVSFVIMKMVGFAIRMIVKILVLIGIAYFIFQYFVSK
ncbi:hypothetical protein [Sulfurihydrogenibium azorense]|jgi:hypothetical protein|uniref:Uncharacterized protein n=1 Tax=Sulfurihydrogenibium azorense (strain DSM 15241 / OCM 825 / Az-Fu1) TaxID=204536 RepID=C1DX16_SULAA|nr:hypothetical protein [Sulfurihydrogenibium azorense]ACN99134.1 hypothetical protein SULAZ_1695 [Sulfurihydrogenibium azorense Az-Fu1]MDM7274445.1 hypothetical protein [Sulfurihydrogenibium azorense]